MKPVISKTDLHRYLLDYREYARNIKPAPWHVRLRDSVRALVGLVLCRIGRHHYQGKTILADLDLYWLKGGEKCARCQDRRIDYAEAAKLTVFAYERGKHDAEVELLARGAGVHKIIALHGKDYVLNLLERTQ